MTCFYIFATNLVHFMFDHWAFSQFVCWNPHGTSLSDNKHFQGFVQTAGPFSQTYLSSSETQTSSFWFQWSMLLASTFSDRLLIFFFSPFILFLFILFYFSQPHSNSSWTRTPVLCPQLFLILSFIALFIILNLCKGSRSSCLA